MEVAHGGADMAVAEQALDGVDVDTGFEQMGGEAVAQGMDAAAVFDAGRATGGMVEAMGGFLINGAFATTTGKEPEFRPAGTPVQPQ